MNHPLPYSAIEEDGNGGDLIKWFSGYYKYKYGYFLPSEKWFEQSGFIKYMKNKDYSLKEIAILIWGLTYEKDNVRSMWYAKYYIDKLEQYKKNKEKYIEYQKQKEIQEEKLNNREVNYETKTQKFSAKDYFAEFME